MTAPRTHVSTPKENDETNDEENDEANDQASDNDHAADVSAPPWWKTGVIYQIYPRSFAHGGSGTDPRVGDLAGITSRLDYLVDLGVDAIWLSPMYPSPMRDFGYDVADYQDVHPLFGRLADLDALVEQAHRKGLRVLLDWVPNHTSDEHEWFRDSRSSTRSPRRNWYVWRDGPAGTAPGSEPPNGWSAAFGSGSAWTFDESTQQWYLHSFLPSQPDLDWRNPEVEAAMFDVITWWLDRGIDGFRIDVVHLIGKDVSDVHASPIGAGLPYFLHVRDPYTHEILRRLRSVVDGYDGDRMLVGEIAVPDPSEVVKFYGDHDELHQNFNFAPLYTTLDAGSWGHHIRSAEELIGSTGAWPTWVLSNHDCQRHRTRYGGDERSARLAALMLLTLRGTPLLYAGEELGLESAEVPADRVVDPGGRDGCRAPIPWDAEPTHGWPTVDPWLPWPPQATDGNDGATQAGDPESVLALYRALLAIRKATPCLQLGDIELLAPGPAAEQVPAGCLAYRRSFDGQQHTVVLDLAGNAGPINLAALVGPNRELVISTRPDRNAGPIDTPTYDLRPFEGVVLASA